MGELQMTSLDSPKEWTMLLSSPFAAKTGEKRAVVIPEAGGGNIRLKSAKPIKWTNWTDRVVELQFQEWREEDGGSPEAVWPFNNFEGGSSVTPQTGKVRISAGGSFTGRVAGTGRILVKYTVTVLAGDSPDGSVLSLDPMIVVEH
jgi:hypothetical protein